MLTYKQSGVDIDEGNRAVDLIKGKIKSTYDNNVIGDLGNFSGLYSLKEFVGMEEPVLLSSTVCPCSKAIPKISKPSFLYFE